MPKINSLFTERVPRELVEDYVRLLGLTGTKDSRDFTKYDLMRVQAVAEYQRSSVETRLREYYMACKADLYVMGSSMTHYKMITVLRQLLRLFDLTLTCRERNVGNRKTMVYRIVRTEDALCGPRAEFRDGRQVVRFD
jgi:hypothetical protein